MINFGDPSDLKNIEIDDLELMYKCRDLAVKLHDFGLTNNEIKILLYLLLYGPCTVHTLHQHVRIHRVDIYHNLSLLLSRGIVVLSDSARPRKYSALPIRDILYKLVSTEMNFLETVSSNKEYCMKLLGSTAMQRHGNNKIINDSEGVFQLLVGDAIYIKMEQMIVNANRQVLAMLADERLQEGLFCFLKDAASRGVDVKVISTRKPKMCLSNNSKESGTYSIVKMPTNYPITNYIISDESDMVLFSDLPSRKQQALGFYTNKTEIIKSFYEAFSMCRTIIMDSPDTHN
ncbi:MAG TPA: helix-turn-helix domain-containing protein [Nitrososphaera sp.]|nr:helix-turn-helix domain-containing protein [Nitrososphaera sp.]